SGISRKTGWLMAEQAGLDGPYRMQSLLGRSSWNADALRDLVRAEVIGSLGDPRGVLVVDETGFLKKGTHSVGVSARKGRARARPLRGSLLARLAPPHDPVHGSARLSRRAFRPAAPRRGKQTERKESARRRRMRIATVPPPSVPEIRYLIARLLLAPI